MRRKGWFILLKAIDREKQILLCVFFFLSGSSWNEKERTREIKEQIEEELRQLEDEITACK